MHVIWLIRDKYFWLIKQNSLDYICEILSLYLGHLLS